MSIVIAAFLIASVAIVAVLADSYLRMMSVLESQQRAPTAQPCPCAPPAPPRPAASRKTVGKEFSLRAPPHRAAA